MKFIPSKDKFVIVTPTPAAAQVEYQIKIIECRLYLHSLEVTHSLALAHEQMLHKSNMHYPIRRVTMKHLSIPANHLSVLHDNIYLGAVPERIVVGLVSDSSLNGGYQENPFNFQHFGLNHLALYVNGELIPSKPYQPNFAEHRYIREYNSLVEGMGLLYTDQTLPISREEYEGGYTLYLFDLIPDQNCKSCITPPRTGSVRIEIKFTQALTTTIDVILYAEFESSIEIDKYRNIITPF